MQDAGEQGVGFVGFEVAVEFEEFGEEGEDEGEGDLRFLLVPSIFMRWVGGLLYQIQQQRDEQHPQDLLALRRINGGRHLVLSRRF